MSVNPPRNDACRPYGDVRFVLIRKIGRLKRIPSRGLILDWKREGRRREVFVVWHDDAALKPVVKMDWLRIEHLIPVPVDPNWTGQGGHG